MTFRVESEIQIGEATKAGVAAARRLGTGAGSVVIDVIAFGLAAAFVGDLLGAAIAYLARLPAHLSLWLQIGLAFGLLILVGAPAYRRALRNRERLSWWDAPGPFPTSYQITDAAFVYSMGGITKLVQWAVVTELLRSQDWWVLMAQGEPCFIPSRAFEGTIAERTFLSSILDHLDEAARRRSRDAISFLESTS